MTRTDGIGQTEDTASRRPPPRPSADVVLSTLAGCRVGLIGFGRDEAGHLAGLLEARWAFVRPIAPDEADPGSMLLGRFELLALRLPDEGMIAGWTPDRIVTANDRPLVFVGTPAALTRVGPTLCRSGHDFVPLPFDDQTFLLRACHVIRAATTNLLPPAVASLRAEAGGSASLRSPAPSSTPGPARVLLADDDPTVIALLSATLTNYGIECHAAGDGQEALDLARRLRPDALVLDVNMPHLDGFAVLAALRNDPALQDLPVVMLSARQQEADVLRGFGLGADDYVVKPFNPMELAVRVKRMLRLR